MKRFYMFALSMLLGAAAYAHNPAPTPTPDPTTTVAALAGAAALSGAEANQSQGQDQQQAQGQQQAAIAAQGQSQSANNEGNSTTSSNSSTNSTNVSTNVQRSAPALAQGSVVIQTCGAGGNAGGSVPGGAGFMGFAYITAKCYDLSYAAAYAALGEKQAACDILRLGKYGNYAKRRKIKLPEVCK